MAEAGNGRTDTGVRTLIARVCEDMAAFIAGLSVDAEDRLSDRATGTGGVKITQSLRLRWQAHWPASQYCC